MNLKTIYGTLLQGITLFAGIGFAKKFDARIRFHRKLNLKNPITLADKVSYIELYEQPALASVCSDKFAVRGYVAKKGLSDILIPLAGGVWNQVEEIDFSGLPDNFIIKATHGCKMNYPVPNKRKMDQEKCKKEMQRWLDTTYGLYSVEPHYKKIPHRIYAEKFLGAADELIEYKFHCMNGVPQFVLVCSNRKADGDKRMGVTLDLFTMEWQPILELLPSGGELPGTGVLKKPEHFERMKEIARRLSEDFKFVRVDLYELNGNVYFGELTFSPACGIFPNFTNKFNLDMGRRLRL